MNVNIIFTWKLRESGFAKDALTNVKGRLFRKIIPLQNGKKK